MSYDIYLQIDTGSSLVTAFYVGNYTSNVVPMWTEALNDVSLRELSGATCIEAAGPLADAVERMEADPDRYRAMNPENGWGDYDGALRYLRTLAEACVEHPKCTICVSS